MKKYYRYDIMNQLPTNQQINQQHLTPEELLYQVIDNMNILELELLKKNLEDEIGLRKYKITRVNEMKKQLEDEYDKLFEKHNVKITKLTKPKPIVFDDSDEDEVVSKKAPAKKPITRKRN
jgi:Phosducin